MYRKGIMAAGLAAALAAWSAAPAQAALLGEGLRPASGASLAQPAQLFFNPLDFVLGGRDYCWYDDGWRGPGWYWCGFGYTEGSGWGGGEGFHGWRERRYERDWHGHGGGMEHRHDGGEMEHHGGGGMEHHGGGGMEHHGGGGMEHHGGGGMEHHGGGGMEHHGGGGMEHHGGGGGGQHGGGGGGQHGGGDHHQQ